MVPSDLLTAAKKVFSHAYAPYSNFPVAAALRAKSGAIYAGVNVENASYGLSRCAEQSAIQALNTAGEREFTEILVLSRAEEPASPCGACRQILFEFSPEAVVHLVNEAGVHVETTVAALLPGGFRLFEAPPS